MNNNFFAFQKSCIDFAISARPLERYMPEVSRVNLITFPGNWKASQYFPCKLRTAFLAKSIMGFFCQKQKGILLVHIRS